MSDGLARSARAVRDTYDGRSRRSDATRRAVLAHAIDERRRRNRVLAIAVPLAAVLALSTAWAAVTGRLPRVLDHWWPGSSAGGHHGGFVPGVVATPPLPSPPLPSPPAAPPSPATTPPPFPATPPATASPSAPSRPLADTPAPTPRAPHPHASSTAPPPTPPGTDAETSAFAAAHRAHFAGGDPARALAAWDAYLAAYPNGRFALEARYNRALTLVRRGRRDEARAALSPFADGTYGGYRQREAHDLLNALGGTPSP